LDRRGQRTQAEGVEARSTSSSVNEEDVFDLVVRFKDRKGRVRTAIVETTNHGAIETARAKGKLAIEYDPEDPSRARLQGESASGMGLMILLPAGFTAVGLPLFALGLARSLRARRVYRDGREAEAEVVEVVETSSSENDATVMEMRYA